MTWSVESMAFSRVLDPPCLGHYCRPNSELVWRAIMSSSLVGMTQADTLLCGFERRGRPAVFAWESSSIPSQAEASLIRRRISGEFSPMPAVNTSASMPPNTAARAPISLAAR